VSYTRSYFSDGGDTIVTATSNSDVLQYYRTSTGEHISSMKLFPGKSYSSLYVQSLRGSNHKNGTTAVLAAY